MSTQSEHDRRREIHERAEKASSGPWGRYSVDFREHRSHSVKTATGVVAAFTGYGPDGGTAHQDAEFIANARFYVPWLLDLAAEKDIALEEAGFELAAAQMERDTANAEVAKLRAAIQRAREAAAAMAADTPAAARQAVGRVLRTLDGEVPDGDLANVRRQMHEWHKRHNPLGVPDE